MSEFVVVTTPFTKPSSLSRHTPNAQRIIGVNPVGSKTMLESGYTLDGSEQDKKLELPDEVSERIADFFDQAFTPDPLARPFYNCHSFAFYATGKITRLRRYSSFDGTFMGQMKGAPLVTGDTYCTLTSTGIENHSLVATDASGENISVLGDNQPLVIMSSVDIIKFYGAVDLARFRPVSAY